MFEKYRQIGFAAALIIGGVLTCPLVASADSSVSQPGYGQGDISPGPHDLVQGAHVEGHIAFLRAELAIAPEQEALWSPVAAAMREDVKNLRDAEAGFAGQIQSPETAIQYLEKRALFANLRAQGEARFLTALRPLYDKLSDTQKQIADELFIPAMPN